MPERLKPLLDGTVVQGRTMEAAWASPPGV